MEHLRTPKDEPFLPLGLHVLDAQMLRKNMYSGGSLYIKQYNKKWFLATRTFNYEVDWETHFEVTPQEGYDIVNAGYAAWWMNEPPKSS